MSSLSEEDRPVLQLRFVQRPVGSERSCSKVLVPLTDVPERLSIPEPISYFGSSESILQWMQLAFCATQAISFERINKSKSTPTVRTIRASCWDIKRIVRN
jgi:hypothetical protein